MPKESQEKKQDKTAKAEVIASNPIVDAPFVYGMLESLKSDDYTGKLVDFLTANQRQAYEQNQQDVDATVQTRVSKLCSAYECTLEDTFKGDIDANDYKIVVDGIKGILRQEISPLVKPAPIAWSFEHLGQSRAEVMTALRDGKTITGMFTISQTDKAFELDGGVVEIRQVFQGELHKV